ncbi:MAG: hypothetical protein AB7U83_08895 [Vicinamibacterales bacterium]
MRGGDAAPRSLSWGLAAAYGAAAVAVTWPLALGPTTRLAGDYGDSLFVAWVMAWVGDHLWAVLGGDFGAWTAMWQAPIFAPAPDALTFSEHFLAQSVQALPVLRLTGSAIAGYNFVFLATIALTGLAAHQLTVRLSGHHLAGVVAGLTCTFSDYRFFWSIVHLHTLSIHWWILALWALDRFVATGRAAALAGLTLALVLLHLSSNYLLAYCAPFTVAVAVWSMARHGRLRDPRVWTGLAIAAAASLLVVLPIAARYLATREALQVARTAQEMAGNSASVAAYRGALPWLGPLAALAVVGVAVGPAGPHGLSRRSRGALLAFAAAAVALSFGPIVTVGATTVTGPYALLSAAVPGFSGLRVPHRFVAVATVFLSILAGFGAVWLARWRAGLVVVVAVVALSTRTAWSRPFPIDVPIVSAPLAQPPAYLHPAVFAPPNLPPGVAAPPVYFRVPPEAVLVELPFGTTAYEVRYTWFTRLHGRRVLNGYSGLLPAGYTARQAALADPTRDPDAAWAALAPATYVLVHGAAWPDDTAGRIATWLEGRGARLVVDAGDGARLYELPPR